MINQAHRFHGHASLNYLHQKGMVIRTGGLNLKYIANSSRESYRAAVIVSKKVSKSAVIRNRIRRRVYEVIRLHVSVAKRVDFAVQVYDVTFAKMSYPELIQRVTELLARADLLT